MTYKNHLCSATAINYKHLEHNKQVNQTLSFTTVIQQEPNQDSKTRTQRWTNGNSRFQVLFLSSWTRVNPNSINSSFTLFANSGAPGGVYLSWQRNDNDTKSNLEEEFIYNIISKEHEKAYALDLITEHKIHTEKEKGVSVTYLVHGFRKVVEVVDGLVAIKVALESMALEEQSLDDNF